LAGDAIALGHLDDRKAVADDLEDCGITLFDHAELHEPVPALLLVDARRSVQPGGAVKRQPKSCPGSAEVRVKHQLKSSGQATTE